MIVGGYSLDLYCENWAVPPDEVTDRCGHKCREDGVDSFVGHNRAECVRAARRVGWRINFAKGTAYCPLCSGINTSPKPQ